MFKGYSLIRAGMPPFFKFYGFGGKRGDFTLKVGRGWRPGADWVEAAGGAIGVT